MATNNNFDLLRYLRVVLPFNREQAAPVAKAPVVARSSPVRVLRSKIRINEMRDGPSTATQLAEEGERLGSSGENCTAAGVRSSNAVYLSDQRRGRAGLPSFGANPYDKPRPDSVPPLERGRAGGVIASLREHERAVILDPEQTMRRDPELRPPWTRQQAQRFFADQFQRQERQQWTSLTRQGGVYGANSTANQALNTAYSPATVTTTSGSGSKAIPSPSTATAAATGTWPRANSTQLIDAPSQAPHSPSDPQNAAVHGSTDDQAATGEASLNNGPLGVEARGRRRDFGSHLQGAAGLPTTVPDAYHVDGLTATTLSHIGTRGGKRHFALSPPQDRKNDDDDAWLDALTQRVESETTHPPSSPPTPPEPLPPPAPTLSARARHIQAFQGTWRGPAGWHAEPHGPGANNVNAEPHGPAAVGSFVEAVRRASYSPSSSAQSLREVAAAAYRQAAAERAAARDAWARDAEAAQRVRAREVAAARVQRQQEVEAAAARRAQEATERRRPGRTSAVTRASAMPRGASPQQVAAELLEQMRQHRADALRRREAERDDDARRLQVDTAEAVQFDRWQAERRQAARETLVAGLEEHRRLRERLQRARAEEEAAADSSWLQYASAMQRAEEEAVRVARRRRAAYAAALEAQAGQDRLRAVASLAGALVDA